MKRFLQLTLVTLIAVSQLAVVSAIATDDVREITTVGKVVRATLYRGQALVTRQVEIDGDVGSREIVIADLPHSIIDGNIYAESSDQMEVRAVRFRQRAVGEEPREEVRKLDASLADLNSQNLLVAKKLELITQKSEYLDRLQDFVAPTAGAELSSGVLNADTLQTLTQFSFEQRAALAEEFIQLTGEKQQLAEQIELLQRQRAELTENAQRTIYEAVLFVEKMEAGPQQLELNYLVGNCGWSPTYTIRANDNRQQVAVEYNALIQQMSGESWDGVQLTLSTASPALSASGPSLAPFYVSLTGGQQQSQAMEGYVDQLTAQYRENKSNQLAYNLMLGNASGFDEKTRLNWSVNQFACATQQIELTNPHAAISNLLSEVDSDDAPSLSYALPNPVSLASRSDQQMVRIFRGDLDSGFYHVATPILSSYVYREAEVENNSDQDLLAGPVTVYLDGRFVGRAEIPTVARGETFVIGFGSDAQLRARREFVDKSEAVQGGNMELKMEYRVVVENYKDENVSVRVLDRLPFSDQASSVRVALTDPSIPLSKDPVYLRREKPKNILRWDVDVAADSSGESALEIEYAFTLDYDRNYVLTGMANSESFIEEFEQLERQRLKR